MAHKYEHISTGNGFSVKDETTGVTSKVINQDGTIAASSLNAVLYTTTGGAAAEAITVTGVTATDIPLVTLVDQGTNTVTVVTSAVTADTLTVTFSADPGADAVISYAIIKA